MLLGLWGLLAGLPLHVLKASWGRLLVALVYDLLIDARFHACCCCPTFWCCLQNIGGMQLPLMMCDSLAAGRALRAVGALLALKFLDIRTSCVVSRLHCPCVPIS